MSRSVSYKNYLIRFESFQREASGEWIPQYYCTRENSGANGIDFPSQQYQLNDAFPTQADADDLALRRAMEWIDKKLKSQ